MTFEDHAIWTADLAERQHYAETLCLVHLSMNYESDKALGVFDELDAPAPTLSEPGA